MRQMQRFYGNRKPVTVKPSVGALVIVWHQVDKAFKRGQIIDYSASREKFKVHLIDFGGRLVCPPTDIYELEKSFTRLSPLAIQCTFENVLLNRSAKEINDALSEYCPDQSVLSADFIRSMNERTVVSVQVNNKNLMDLMIRDKLLTELPKGMYYYIAAGHSIKLSSGLSHDRLSSDRYSHGTSYWADHHRGNNVNHELSMLPSPILWL